MQDKARETQVSGTDNPHTTPYLPVGTDDWQINHLERVCNVCAQCTVHSQPNTLPSCPLFCLYLSRRVWGKKMVEALCKAQH